MYRQIASCLSSFVVLSLTPSVQAVTTTWTDANNNQLWSNATNWSAGQPTLSLDANFPSTIPHPVGGTGYVLASGTEQAASITFNAIYTINPADSFTNVLQLATGNVTCNQSGVATIAVPLLGTAGLTKSGSGFLFLGASDPSTFTGTVTIAGGTLLFGNNLSLGNAANPIALNNGTLQYNGSAPVSMSRSITIGVFFPTILQNNNTWTMNGGFDAASGSNPLNIFGNSTLVLTASGSRSGQTHIQNGTVRLNNGASLGTGASHISNNGRLEIAPGITHSNFIFLKSNGTLATGGVGATHNGTISVDANGSSVFLNTGPSATSTLQLGGPGTNQYTGGTGAKTVVNGAGRVTILTAINDYAGDWQIDSGTLRPAGGLSLGTGTSPIVVNNSGTLQLFSVTFDRAINLNAGSTLAFESGGQSYGTHTIASGAAVTFAFKGAALFGEILGDAPNDITGGNAVASISVTSDTAGNTLILNHSNDYAGQWVIQPFVTVRMTDAMALGTGTSTTVFLTSTAPNGGTLELGGVTLARGVTMSNGSTLRGTGTASVTGTVNFMDLFSAGTRNLATSSASDILTIGDAPNDYTGGPALGGLTQTTIVSGPGTVVLPFANDYPNDWAIKSGTLRIGNGASLGTATSVIGVGDGANTAALEIAGVTLDRGVALFTNATLRGTGTAASNGTITFASNPSQVTIGTGASPTDVFTLGNAANDLTGGDSGSTITVSGAGKVVLTQSSNYAGNWIVSSGSTLQVSNTTGSATGIATGTVTVASGGTLQGSGFIAGPVQNNGSVAPGTSAGKLTLTGAYTQSASGSLKIELGGTAPGTGYDQLFVSGAASLAGTLDVSLLGGFKPATGNAFDVVVGGSRSGTFGNALLPNLSGRIEWNTTYTSTKATISVLATYYAGDINRDSHVNVADISALEAALSDLDKYRSTNGLADPQKLNLVANVDGLGVVTNADVQSLIVYLANNAGSLPAPGGGSVTAVPEPTALTLAVIALAGVAPRFRSVQRKLGKLHSRTVPPHCLRAVDIENRPADLEMVSRRPSNNNRPTAHNWTCH